MLLLQRCCSSRCFQMASGASGTPPSCPLVSEATFLPSRRIPGVGGGACRSSKGSLSTFGTLYFSVRLTERVVVTVRHESREADIRSRSSRSLCPRPRETGASPVLCPWRPVSSPPAPSASSGSAGWWTRSGAAGGRMELRSARRAGRVCVSGLLFRTQEKSLSTSKPGQVPRGPTVGGPGAAGRGPLADRLPWAAPGFPRPLG